MTRTPEAILVRGIIQPARLSGGYLAGHQLYRVFRKFFKIEVSTVAFSTIFSENEKKKSEKCRNLPNMKVKDLIKIIGSVSTVLILLFGLSLATVLKKVKGIIHAPQQINTLVILDSIQEREIHDLIHAQEFTWDLLRLMTDNHDSTVLRKVTDQSGVDHDVDIRTTAEGVELAFVFDYFVVFQIRIDNVDNRRFILVHDYESGETEKYFIE